MLRVLSDTNLWGPSNEYPQCMFSRGNKNISIFLDEKSALFGAELPEYIIYVIQAVPQVIIMTFIKADFI